MTDQPSVEQLAGAYVNLRTEIENREEAHKKEMEGINNMFKEVGEALLEYCNSQNIDSVKTKKGTVMRRVTERYWTSDWESMHSFIRDHDALNLLENRIHNKNMESFLADNPDEMPMGLQLNRKYVVSVRKPTKSED